MLLYNLAATATRLARRDDNDWYDDDEDRNCVYETPGPNGYVSRSACNSYYNYEPRFAPAVAVAVIFGILTAVHVFQGVVFKKVITVFEGQPRPF